MKMTFDGVDRVIFCLSIVDKKKEGINFLEFVAFFMQRSKFQSQSVNCTRKISFISHYKNY